MRLKEAASGLLRCRFAPSPTGYMHLGNVWTAFLAWLEARQLGARLILRMEDIDEERSQDVFADAIREDLSWLGLLWDAEERQQTRYARYEAALAEVSKRGLLYPCFCTRARLTGVGAPHAGEAQRYDGRCRRMSEAEREAAMKERIPSWRVHVPPRIVSFTDATYGEQAEEVSRTVGDFRVRRADGLFAYPLAVAVDDMEMGVTHVLRGRDLLPQTGAQIYLIETLGGIAPAYRHVPMIIDREGRRLSKRQKGLTVRELRAAGKRAEEILSDLAFAGGLVEERGVYTLSELVLHADFAKLRKEDIAIDC